MDVDFSDSEFRGLTREEVSLKCREMAFQAIRLAANANGAKQWLPLVEELEASAGVSRESDPCVI